MSRLQKFFGCLLILLLLVSLTGNAALFYWARQQARLAAERQAQIESLRQPDLFSSVRVSDYLFTRDRLFAEMNLDSEELKLYDQVSANLAVDPPVPDLVIYLQASVDALLHRLARRNATCDRFVERAYLERLTEAYARFFHDYADGPLLIVNASQIDPVNNDADFEQLFQQIERTTGGRHFFNPVAAALA